MCLSIWLCSICVCIQVCKIKFVGRGANILLSELKKDHLHLQALSWQCAKAMKYSTPLTAPVRVNAQYRIYKLLQSHPHMHKFLEQLGILYWITYTWRFKKRRKNLAHSLVIQCSIKGNLFLMTSGNLVLRSVIVYTNCG